MCRAGGEESLGIRARISWYNMALRLLLPWQNEIYDLPNGESVVLSTATSQACCGEKWSSKECIYPVESIAVLSEDFPYIFFLPGTFKYPSSLWLCNSIV